MHKKNINKLMDRFGLTTSINVEFLKCSYHHLFKILIC